MFPHLSADYSPHVSDPKYFDTQQIHRGRPFVPCVYGLMDGCSKPNSSLAASSQLRQTMEARKPQGFYVNPLLQSGYHHETHLKRIVAAQQKFKSQNIPTSVSGAPLSFQPTPVSNSGVNIPPSTLPPYPGCQSLPSVTF